MSATMSRQIPVVVRPAETRAVRLVDAIRGMSIDAVRQRIDETRAMSDDQVRDRHLAENRVRAEAAAARMAAR